MYKIFDKLDKKIGFKTADAHCDIPCGIYDPINAQIAALTVVRMVDLMQNAFNLADKNSLEYINEITRLIMVKEEHAERVKHEVRIIWGDTIKPADLKNFPNLNTLVHDIMTLASTCKHKVDRQAGVDLLNKVNEFASTYYQIKNLPTITAPAPYDPKLDIVYRKV